MSASAPKSISGVDGSIALAPKPEMGAANAVSVSALTGLFTVNVAVSGIGQSAGGDPDMGPEDPGDTKGSQGQLSCGAKVIVITHDCPGAREKLDPAGEAHVSCSVKLGSPLKSLGALLSKTPVPDDKLNVRPFSVLPARSLFESVMVCVVGAEPSN